MGYESAPATQLLAVSCAACGRPLVDAQSIETGMGPDCRAKYGAPEHLTEEQRAAANKLVYVIAARQNGAEVASMLSDLRGLGCHTLVVRIVKRIASQYVAVFEDIQDGFTVKMSYDVSMEVRVAGIPGRRWDKVAKVNTFPASSKRAVWEALKRARPRGKCLGPKGEFSL